MGLRIGYWRKVVERSWSMDFRGQYLGSFLQAVAPRDAHGNPVRTLSELRQAPILTKQAFRESVPEHDLKARFHRHTAGSSGNPTDVWLSRNELGRMLGVRDYCYRHCGIRVGDREGRLWGRPEKGLKSRFKQFMLNRRVFNTSGPLLSSEVQRLIQWRPTYLYGYASLLMECAKELECSGQFIPRLKCVIVTAETILSSQKEYLSSVFECPVYEEYGASEFDLIGFECSSGHRHLVNPWLILESGPEEQALVTDISRKTQALVRYELGDVLQIAESDCNELGDSSVIQRLEGRSNNRFARAADNQRFHAVEFAYAIDRFQRDWGQLFQFTVVQIKPGIFKVLCDPIPEVGAEKLSEHVENSIKNNIGFNIKVEIFQNEDPHNSKRSYFING